MSTAGGLSGTNRVLNLILRMCVYIMYYNIIIQCSQGGEKIVTAWAFLALSLSSKKLQPSKVYNNKLQTSTMYLKTLIWSHDYHMFVSAASKIHPWPHKFGSF